MITKEQAATTHEFHFGECRRVVGPRGGLQRVFQERWRANGRLRTWKRNPERWELPIKYGLRSYAYLNNQNAGLFHTAAECPLNQE